MKYLRLRLNIGKNVDLINNQVLDSFDRHFTAEPSQRIRTVLHSASCMHIL